jgi:hypothetical protein
MCPRPAWLGSAGIPGRRVRSRRTGGFFVSAQRRGCRIETWYLLAGKTGVDVCLELGEDRIHVEPAEIVANSATRVTAWT